MKDSHTALLSITLCSRSISQTLAPFRGDGLRRQQPHILGLLRYRLGRQHPLLRPLLQPWIGERARGADSRGAGTLAGSGEGGKLQKAICYAPADIRTRWGKRDPKGRELSAETEFADHGINFATAQQDRQCRVSAGRGAAEAG